MAAAPISHVPTLFTTRRADSALTFTCRTTPHLMLGKSAIAAVLTAIYGCWRTLF